MRIKVTDFGTAKILEKKDGEEVGESSYASSVRQLTRGAVDRANSFVGTAEYVSPELLSSKTAYRRWDAGVLIDCD
jgi:3-phosphoinositide dependent protein kinase-1